jgi:hypothetical protein
VSHARELSDAEFNDALHSFDRTAFRLELQDSYLVAEEADLFAAFLRGSPPPATTVPELAEWYRRIAEHIRQGRCVERVRVQQDPPTPYQQFERWLDRWNIEAGETMQYLTRQRAHEIGLLPAAGRIDWWLLDDERLILIQFDEIGRPIQNEMTTDPATVTLVREWRDLAVRHSVRANARGAAA